MRLAGGSMRRFRPALAAVRSAEVCAAAAAAAAAAGRRCISQRAGRALGLLPSYLADARSAPASCLNLSVAENQMLADLLTPRLAAAGGSFPDELIYYQPTPGRADMREAVARYMSSSLYAGRHCVNPEQLIIGAGCNAVLENLFFTIAEPGSAVLVPAPYYAAFDFDLSSRAGMAVVPVVPEGLAAAGSSGSGFMEPATYYPTAAGLDAAYEAAEAAGTPPAALLVSSPNNPLGIIYPPSVIAEMLRWCEQRGIHYVSDEIYGGASAWCAGADGDGATEAPAAASSAPVVARDVLGWEADTMGDRLHVVYALSKDFGLSGLRVGVLYTQNEAALAPLQKLNDLCQTSSHTQAMVTELLNDTAWLQNFETTARLRLQERHARLTSVLDKVGIEHMGSEAEAGLFTWMDLRPWLPCSTGSSAGAERALSQWLMNEVGVAMTPGLSMCMTEPGFYRMVFSAATDEDFAVAMKRIETHFSNS
jgi:aspartate/methionine/tyrosine aminotransferase